MSGNITSAVTSALTPRGYNAAKSVSTASGNAYKDWLKQLNSYSPAINSGLESSLNNINMSPETRTSQYAAGAYSNANQAANQAANYMRSQGYGDGAIGGAGVGYNNQAAQSVNQYNQTVSSPEYHQQQLAQFFQLLNGLNAMYSGDYSSAASALNQVNGSNPLASILGQYLTSAVTK